MARLADIYKQESKTGGGVSSALGKRLAEKIDPRQIFDQSGLITAMFPSLKSYSAIKPSGGDSLKSKITPTAQLDSGALTDVAVATKMTAKNTMVLPAMARDMNLMRQNIAKVVKLQGGAAATKGDMFFMRAKERESIFESAFSKLRGKAGSVGLPGPLGGTKRDGQSKSTALYVETVGLSDTLLGALGGAAAGAVGGKLSGALAKALPFLASATLPILGIAGLAGLLYFLIKKDSGEAETVDKMEKGGGYTPEQGGRAEPTTPQASDEELKKVRESMRSSEDPAIRAAAAELDRRDAVKALPDESEAEKRRLGLSVSPEISTTPTPAITPTTESIPSNVVVSGSGEAIRTGSGGYVTSGEPSTAPTPAAPTSPKTPSKVSQSGIEGAIKMALAQEGISDEKTQLAIMGNIKKESGFNPTSENLNYSSLERLRTVFPTATKNLTDEQASQYLKNPEGLAELVYGGKMGNSQPGDGFKYRGRGFIQLTGKDNYAKMGAALGVDLVNNPDLANDPVIAARITARYMKDAKLRNSFSTQEEANRAVTQAIAGPRANLDRGIHAQNLAKVNMYTTQMAGGGAGSAGGVGGSSATLASATPSSKGAAVTAASMAVAEGQRASLGGAGSVVVDNSQRTTVASAASSGKPASAYDKDIVDALMSSSYA